MSCSKWNYSNWKYICVYIPVAWDTDVWLSQVFVTESVTFYFCPNLSCSVSTFSLYIGNPIAGDPFFILPCLWCFFIILSAVLTYLFFISWHTFDILTFLALYSSSFLVSNSTVCLPLPKKLRNSEILQRISCPYFLLVLCYTATLLCYYHESLLQVEESNTKSH